MTRKSVVNLYIPSPQDTAPDEEYYLHISVNDSEAPLRRRIIIWASYPTKT